VTAFIFYRLLIIKIILLQLLEDIISLAALNFPLKLLHFNSPLDVVPKSICHIHNIQENRSPGPQVNVIYLDELAHTSVPLTQPNPNGVRADSRMFRAGFEEPSWRPTCMFIAAVLLLPMAKYLWVHPLSLIYLRALMCSTLMWGCLKILGFPFASMSVCLSVCFCSVGSPHAPFPSRPHQPRPHPCITATITTLPCEVLCWLRARGLLGNTLDIRFHFPFFPISTV